LTAQAANGAGTVQPQRLTIVTPTTAEFHSGTYRIASSATARGHEVTVIARSAPGLARDERHPAGYRILRVRTVAREGWPMPATVRESLRRRALAAGAPGDIDDARPGDAGVRNAGSPPPDRDPGGPAERARRAARRVGHDAGRVLEIRAGFFEAARIAPPADLVVAYHYLGIGTGLALGRRDEAPVIYYAGDIFLASTALRRLPAPIREGIRRYERSAAQRADSVVTVNDGYARELARRLGVPLPLVVLNCPPRTSPPEVPARRFHEALGLPADTRVVLYHGGFSPERGIEELIAAIPFVDRAVLVLLGFGPLASRFEAIAADPASGGRVVVMPAVTPAELLDWVASADVAAMPILPTTLNHRLTTPNKLWEAISVGVPVVASNLPGMVEIVRAIDAGRLVDPNDPRSIAAGLVELLDEPPDLRAARRARLLAAAHDVYNWETQSDRLFTEFGRLTQRAW
jgi:glycosyltransferase involved in cell wall biosynthesis